MQTHILPKEQSQTRIRAIVELIDGELKIYPIAESDAEADEILNSLLFWKDTDAR